MTDGKFSFWFEYIENPSRQAWGGGHWRLFRAPGEEMPIKVVLVPVPPLNFLSFKTRRPTPEEIEIAIMHRITLDVPRDSLIKLDRLLRQSFKHQFRSELVPGTRLEICDGTDEIALILGDEL